MTDADTDLRRALRERDAARYTCEQLKMQKQTLRSELRRERAEHRITKLKLEASVAWGKGPIGGDAP
jgi:hypothetical protein